MVEAQRIDIYSNTLKDATHTLFIPKAGYSILEAGWMRLEPLTSCHVGFDIMLTTSLIKMLN